MDIALKKKLYTHCQGLLEKRVAEAKEGIAQAQAAANEETKSSAGDKYETGREMMQQEQNKASLQLVEAMKLKRVLDELNPSKTCIRVAPGCLLQTDKGCFYISVSLGEVVMEEGSFILMSAVAPLAKLMAGKKVGEQVQLNGRTYTVEGLV